MRLKGHAHKSKAFGDYETAVLWGKYQELIHKEREDFGVKPEHMYTVIDVLLAKFPEDSREFRSTVPYFTDLNYKYIYQCDYDILLAQAKKLLNEPVYRGGCKTKGVGRKKMPEPMTILRKFAYLSSAINHMVKKGVPLENHCLKVVAYLRDIDKRKKNGSADKPTD